MRTIINRLYYLFWHDLLRRREPFTPQLQRMAKAHPRLFLAVGLANAGFWTWLLLHLGGNKHRVNLDNPFDPS